MHLLKLSNYINGEGHVQRAFKNNLQENHCSIFAKNVFASERWNSLKFQIFFNFNEPQIYDFVIATLVHAYNAYPLNILTEFYWNLWFLKSISNMQLRNMRKVLYRQNISLYSHSRHAKSYIFRQIQLNLKDHL